MVRALETADASSTFIGGHDRSSGVM